MSNLDNSNKFFREIFGSSIKQIEYPYHPSDEILRAFIVGKLKSNQIFSTERVNQLQRGKLNEWSRTEVSAHIMTCRRCSVFVHEFPTKRSTSRSWWPRLVQTLSLEPMRRSISLVPTFARVVMVAQFALILALSGAIYFRLQPTLEPIVTTTENPVSKQDHPPTQLAQPEKSDPSKIDLAKTDLAPPASPESLATKNIEKMKTMPATDTMASVAVGAAQSDVTQLSLLLKSDDPDQQISAAQQLAVLRNPSAVPPLVEAYSTTSNAQVHKVIINALREIWDETQNEYLQAAESLIAFKKSAETKLADPDLHQGLFSNFSFRVSFGQDETSYPIHLKVRFHQDVTLREVNALSRAIGGLFVLDENTPDEAILKLPEKSKEDLNKLIKELEQNPKVKHIEKQN